MTSTPPVLLPRIRPLVLALCCALAPWRCGTPPEENACSGIRDVPLSEGHRGPNGEWIVGDWNAPRFHWGAFTTYRIRHGLGRAVTAVECWASFTHDGAFAQQIGSVCLVIPTCGRERGITDDTVLVRNSASQDFWARIILR